MSGILYEDVMCMAYSSGRNGSIGADAEVYNKLDRLHDTFAGDDLRSNQKYVWAFSDARTNILKAVEHVLHTRKLRFNDEQIVLLCDISSTLRKTGFLDKPQFDLILQELGDIFHAAHLEPGL